LPAGRDRDERTMALFHSQMRRAEERFRRLATDLENDTELDIRLEWIAACVLEIVGAP
jgi:hypothetical protein